MPAEDLPLNPIAAVITAGIQALPAVLAAIEVLAAPDTEPLCDRLKQLLGTESALDAVARVAEERARKVLNVTLEVPTP